MYLRFAEKLLAILVELIYKSRFKNFLCYVERLQVTKQKLLNRDGDCEEM